MRKFWIWLCFLLSTSIIFAENPRKLTVNDIVNDPGLNARAYRQRQFTWAPRGDGVLLLEKNKTQNCDLLKLSINSLKIDTVFTYEQLRWSNDTHSIQLDPFGFISAPDGFRYLLTGENDLFLGDERDGAIVRLTNDGTPKSNLRFSPNGKWISYIRDHNIWIVNCESKNTIRLTTDGSESIFNGLPDWVYA
ncbi:MAG TPA: DPP IV N-terminal domain-containing protein, partial [Candidatus Marinimicrobia bacterium]|nr:DPP IV N-terminal domain-containing protein [Candidatus Neomarinimicrobiota bacterium]